MYTRVQDEGWWKTMQSTVLDDVLPMYSSLADASTAIGVNWIVWDKVKSFQGEMDGVLMIRVPIEFEDKTSDGPN